MSDIATMPLPIVSVCLFVTISFTFGASGKMCLVKVSSVIYFYNICLVFASENKHEVSTVTKNETNLQQWLDTICKHWDTHIRIKFV